MGLELFKKKEKPDESEVLKEENKKDKTFSGRTRPKLRNHYTRSVLKSAFADLDKELKRLKEEREICKKKLKNLNKSADNTKVEENRLQDKLNTLRSKEIEVNNIKQDIIAHLSEVEIRLEKVKKAREGLSDL